MITSNYACYLLCLTTIVLVVGVLLCYNSLQSLPSPTSCLAFILQHLPRNYLICLSLKCGWRRREADNKNERWWNSVGHTVWGISINMLPHTSMCDVFSQQDDCTPGKTRFPSYALPTTRSHTTNFPFSRFVILSSPIFLFRKFHAKTGYITF